MQLMMATEKVNPCHVASRTDGESYWPGKKPLAVSRPTAIIVFSGLQVFGGRLPHLCAGLRLGIAATPHAPVLLVQP